VVRELEWLCVDFHVPRGVPQALSNLPGLCKETPCRELTGSSYCPLISVFICHLAGCLPASRISAPNYSSMTSASDTHR